MSYCRFLISCCAMCFASVGCGPAPGSGSSSWFVGGTPDASPEGNGGGWIGHQGPLLLGFQSPDVRGVKLPGLTGVHVIDAGQLVADGLAGRDFVGAPVLSNALDGSVLAMRIADVLSPDQTGGGWQYAIEQQDPGTGGWVPACAEPAPIVPPIDPPISPARAIAMNGAWQHNGVYIASDGIGFACTTGAVAKCAEWGYPVTATPPTVTEHGLPVTVSGADMAQACARMARADFCAVGASNTLEGTPILFDDIFRSPPSTTGYAFEAAWRGIASTGSPPPTTPALCLSKLRWSTLPFGGGCGTPIPDPRTDAKGEFCEDLTPQQLEEMGALVYSWSSFLDAGLYSYTLPNLSTTLTTASLVPEQVGHLPVWKQTPPDQVPFPATGEVARFEATIFARELPSTMSQTGLLLLSSYLCGSNLLTTTSPPPAGCTKIADEGKVYAPNTPGRTPLRRWTDATGRRSYTTSIAPTTMIQGRWQLVEVVGAVLRASIDLNVRWSSLAGATTTFDVLTRTGDWIRSCYVNAGTSRLTFTGICPDAHRQVDRSEIAALRINYTTASGEVSATAAYDGIDSDVYIALSGGTTTAVAVTWNERAPGARYALSIQRNGGTWSRCVDNNLLANGTSHVFTGACSSTGLTFSLQSVTRLRVCTNIGGQDLCGEAPYDGVASRVAIAIP